MLMRPAISMNLGPAGRVITNPVELRDMLPTFLDAAGAEIPASIEGRSLLQLVRSGGEGWREYIDLEHNICYDVSNHWNGLTDGVGSTSSTRIPAKSSFSISPTTPTS